ncbi:MAG: hypothetical protein IPG43_17040 [Proteobacteria bacterium]|nr:hypothetical protein [Pseudomonadota bacterium]
MAAALLLTAHVALAETATGCDVHAAAMVAEMKASAKAPMSEQEIALVRETARKSCMAQNGGSPTTTAMPAAAPAVAAAPLASQAPAPAARAKSDDSFFGALGAIFSGPSKRKPGNERLLERSQH